MFRVGIHHIRTPEQPVAWASRAIRQFHHIPVKVGRSTYAGGCPTAVLEHTNLTGQERRFAVFTIRHSNVKFLVNALFKFQTGQRFWRIQRASCTVFIEETAASRIQPVAVGTPPRILAVTKNVVAQCVNGRSHFHKGVPVPFAIGSQFTRVGCARFCQQVQVEIQCKSGDVTGQTPKRFACVAGFRVKGQVEHRARVESVIGVAFCGVCHFPQVHDQTAFGKISYICTGNPENVWRSACGQFCFQHVLVAGAFTAAWFIYQSNVVHLGVQVIADG